MATTSWERTQARASCPGGDALGLGECLQAFHDAQVGGEVLRLEARDDTAEVLLGEVVDAADGAGQQAPRPSGL